MFLPTPLHHLLDALKSVTLGWRIKPLATRVLAAAVLASGLAGCSTDRFASVPMIPGSAPRVTGGNFGMERERASLIGAFGGEYEAPAAKGLLNDVMQRVVAASNDPSQNYRITILNSPASNAFALPSGDLFVTRGLLALANDPSEIAAVMAHEVAHVTSRHAIQRAELERRAELITRVVSEVLEDRVGGAVLQAKGQLSLASFSRAQELEADDIGVRTIGTAGYDPFGGVRFLTSLGRDAGIRAQMLGEKPGQRGMNFLSTHPTTPERIAQSLAAARAVSARAVPDSEHERYLTAIDGIVYGDDPEQGLVRGRRFLHPKLGFAFSAPEGFVLENSPTAVVGVMPGKQLALRFDSFRGFSGSPVEALRAGWIEGVSLGQIETFTVNGEPAAMTVAAGTEWSFRLAAIRHNGTTYRFILAARSLTPDIDRVFRQSIESFRPLSAEEIADARPLRIRRIVAQPSDKVSTFVRMMAVNELPQERFLVINGLDRPSIQPGRSYKVIAE